MHTKLGEPIPDDLAAALRSAPGMLPMWDALRPSCQRSHLRSVASAKRSETRVRRIAAVLRLTGEWYARHHSRTVV